MHVRLENLRPGTPFVLDGFEADCELVRCNACAARVRVWRSGRLVSFEDRAGHEHRFIADASSIELWAPGTVVRPLVPLSECLRR